MRLGVLGLGFMGATHIRALNGIDGVTLAAISSSDQKKLAGDLSSVSSKAQRQMRIATPEEGIGVEHCSRLQNFQSR